MSHQIYTELYQHMQWADAGVWKAVLSCEQAVANERLRSTLYHLHLVQHAFLRTWRDEPRDDPYPQFTDLAPMMGWACTYYGAAYSYISALSDDDLVRPMPLAWAERVSQLIGSSPAPTTLGDTILQVPLHSMYHRGQVNSRLREAGGIPPLVDYIAWVWYGRPAAGWPALPAA